MSLTLRPISEFVHQIRMASQAAMQPDERLSYIDLSAVDKEEKHVVSEAVKPLTWAEAPSRARQIVQTNDILVSTVRPNLNGVAQLGAEHDGAIASTGFCVLRANPDVLDSRYLFHWVCSPQFVTEMIKQATGASYPAVSDRIILESLIPYPDDLKDQRRIAVALDKAYTIRKKRREAIKLADDLLRSVFLDMFGDPVTNSKRWPTDQMGRICTFYAGNSLPDGEPFLGQTGGVMHLKVGDMNLPGNEETMLIAREWSEKAQGGVVAPAEAVLLPKRGGAIATNKKRILSRQSALDPNLMAVAPMAPLTIEYLFAWFGLFDLTTISSGSAVPQLNKGDLAPLTIQIPPEHLLNKHSVIVAKVKESISKYREQLKDAEALFSALQQQAFA